MARLRSLLSLRALLSATGPSASNLPVYSNCGVAGTSAAARALWPAGACSMRWYSTPVPEGYVALNTIADNPGATHSVRGRDVNNLWKCLLYLEYPCSPCATRADQETGAWHWVWFGQDIWQRAQGPKLPVRCAALQQSGNNFLDSQGCRAACTIVTIGLAPLTKKTNHKV